MSVAHLRPGVGVFRMEEEWDIETLSGEAGGIWPAASPTCSGSAWLLCCVGRFSVCRDPATGRSAWSAHQSAATPTAPATQFS